MIDPASQNQLNTILQKLGVNKNEDEKKPIRISLARKIS